MTTADEPTGAGPPAAWSYTLARHGDGEAQSALLWALGATGVWVRSRDLVAYFDEQIDLPGDLVAGGSWAAEHERDWLAEWRASVQPIEAGRFDLVPTWLADEHTTAPDRLRILLDPGQAFGSGHHDTTAGCLEALGEPGLVDDSSSVLDVGTGTGVLAIGAALLGARRVRGVDIDPAAVGVAARNAAANSVQIEVAVGSVGETDGQWDVVLANLLTNTVVSLARPLVAALAPGGTLIASGIGSERIDLPVTALTEAGLIDLAVRHRGEWAIVTGRRPAG